MKRIISILMLISSLVYGNIHTNDADVQKLSHKEQQQRVQEAIKAYEKELVQKRGRAAIVGAILGAPAAAYLWWLTQIRGRPRGPIWVDPAFLALQSTLGAMLGSILVLVAFDSTEKSKIKDALQIRTRLVSLQRLPKEQDLLFIAAYRRNIPMMKLLINYQPKFLEQVGIWRALAELYFNQRPTADSVQRLKEMIRKADASPSDQKQVPGRAE